MFSSKQQQNNMNHYQAPSSPTYHHQQLFSKNNRLYQQLLQDDYMTGQNYSKSTQSTSHVAHIKFNQPPITPVKLLKTTSATYQSEVSSPKLQKHISPFKVFQPSIGRMSNHATQSLSSNYCITQHENEQNSTVNLYSLSKNQIQPDLDISSNNVTKKINPDESLNHNATNVNVENILLEDSILKQQKQDVRKISQIIVLEDDKFKKYRSEEYSHLPYNLNQSLESQIEGKMPKILAEKHIKNEITKRFSISQNSENDVQSTFKAVLNEIHVVPYKINNEIRPYTFSVPVQNKESYAQSNTCITFPHHQEDSNKITTKANSLNLRHSNHSQYDNDEELGTAQTRNLYFSNHAHLNHNRVNKNLAFSNPQIEQHVKTRQTPKSQPKYSQNCDKNTRSNSIQCKSKPAIIGKEGANSHSTTKNPQLLRDGLEQSQVTKLFKNTNVLPDDNILAQQASIIYQSTALNICCSLNRDTENHNKINFMRGPEQKEEVKLKYSPNQSPFFLSSIDMTKVAPLSYPKANYKINPIHQIRELNQNQGPKGIKLVGFPSKKQKF